MRDIEDKEGSDLRAFSEEKEGRERIHREKGEKKDLQCLIIFVEETSGLRRKKRMKEDLDDHQRKRRERSVCIPSTRTLFDDEKRENAVRSGREEGIRQRFSMSFSVPSSSPGREKENGPSI